MNTDTIAAIATPPGRGGIGIVRVSGPGCAAIAEAVLAAPLPAPRRAVYKHFYAADGELLDQGLVVYFPAPGSFTGEAVLEFHGHGGVVVMDRLLRRMLELGARLARPGEFSERAFLNGKLDLAQAEAVADLIDSVSEQAARCALRSLQGEFSRHIEQLAAQLVELRTYVEAGIDFPDEELDLLADGMVAQKITALQAALADTLARARQGWLLREGIRLVIVGRPNVGKSSLLNQLAQRDTAIVTPIPGTTRDVVRDTIQLDGMPVQVYDTAGLRDTADPVEQEGIRRAHRVLNEADVALLLIDDQDMTARENLYRLAELPPHSHALTVCNKCDLSGRPAGLDEAGILHISAKTGAGIEALKTVLKATQGLQSEESGTFMARRRHLDALERTATGLVHAQQQAGQGHSELLAEELRLAHHALGEITGVFSSEDLLSEIFAGFCIGK